MPVRGGRPMPVNSIFCIKRKNLLTIFVKFAILFRQNKISCLKNRMERWSSGLRHTLGKRARLTASAGSNPVLSATYASLLAVATVRGAVSHPFLFLIANPAVCFVNGFTKRLDGIVGRNYIGLL